MRIGLITPGFSANETDWCIPALLDLVRVLAERDDVTVFALRYPHHRQPYHVHGATVYPTGGATGAGVARLPILLHTLRGILAQARRRRFDVLLALWAHEPGFLATLAGRLTKTPVVVSILGGELADLPEIGYGGDLSRANRWLVARALAAADRVTVGSRWLERQVAGRLASPAEVLPLGFEPSRFRPSGPVGSAPRLLGAPRLLHVGSLSSVKDHRLLLAAFARIGQRHPEARLHLVGEGVSEEAVDPLVTEPAIRDRIEVHGAVDHGRLAEVYRQADLLLQTSRFESQGLAVLEAAACGCPAIGTRVGILPELCPEDLLVAPGDVDALAEKTSAVLADRDLRARLSERQRQKAGEFALPVTAGNLRRLLADLASPVAHATFSDGTD